MATSNRDRVGRGFELLAEGLGPWVDDQMRDHSGNADWFAAYTAQVQRPGQEMTLADPKVQLEVIDHFWHPVFRKTLGRSERSIVFLLRDIRNRWAHNATFGPDEAYRALDGVELLLRAASAGPQAAQAQRLKDEIMRDRYAEQEKRSAAAGSAPITSQPVAGLPSWRDVVTPHHDVATGRFQQAEFAADLGQVVRGEGAPEYVDPVEFFRRTYLTHGLRDLLTQAAQRVTRRGGAPVIDLQTTFGGGKTHSMLALWHLFSGCPLDDLPSEVRDVVSTAAGASLPAVNRAAVVGTDLQVDRENTDGGRPGIRTMWGEIAWQLGGAEGYAVVADADRSSTSPGGSLTELFRRYAPCVVLIDEWIAYARQLFGRDNLRGGSFDTHFTFAQTLTEAARAVDGVLVVVSIPASEARPGAGDDEGVSAWEVGGYGGREALRRLKHVVGRMESAWRAASAEESFEIVRRRIFEPLTPHGEQQRDAVVRAFGDLYRASPGDFPRESRDPGYARRFASAYPIHPELFDRLYEDWSTLDRFQRTRGVLRLMAAVVHSLWARQDHAPVILPASIPLDDPVVRTELTRYLDPEWEPIIDTDVDGPASLPVKLDTEVTNLGRYSAARRVARTVFLGSAPTLRSANQGVEASRVRLGCALPGEAVATYGDALNRLASRATYLYAAGGRYWYGTQPGVTRLAAEIAERLLAHDRDAVHQQIERRLHGGDRGAFAAVHVAPRSGADVPDDGEVRLVVLAPRSAHIARSEESEALADARAILERRGNAARERRNMLVFLAADHRRVEDLEAAAAAYLAWQQIVDDAENERINLDGAQRRQAVQQRTDADRVVTLRIAETYHWALVPAQPEWNGPIVWDAVKIEGQGSLAARTTRKLTAEGLLYEQYAPALLRMQLSGPLAPMWADGHVRAADLWDAFTRYCYLPRIASSRVLYDAVGAGPASTDWARDAFATADAVDVSTGRYVGLVAGGLGSTAPGTLLVRPDRALAQIEAERAALQDSDGRSTSDVVGPGHAPERVQQHTGQQGDDRPAEQAPVVRFYGVATLDPERPTKNFATIHEEIVQPLVSLLGTEVEVTVEVRAKNPGGFPAHVVRTVSENARALHLQSHEFEES